RRGQAGHRGQAPPRRHPRLGPAHCRRPARLSLPPDPLKSSRRALAMPTRLLTLALALLATPAAADTLSAVPESVALVGRDDARQLVITAKDEAGREHD